MIQHRTQCENHYRLVLGEDGIGRAGSFEFEASGPESALLWAQRHCAGREAEVFENGRSLGLVKNDIQGGFWVITPPGAQGVARRFG